MVKKIISFPFTVVGNVFRLVFAILRVVFGLATGLTRFVVSRIFGTAYGALIGLVMGIRNVGVRFPGLAKRK